MKEGIFLQEMVAEITCQDQLKEDCLVDIRSLKLEPSGNQLYLHMYDSQAEVLESFEINSTTHRQIDSYLKIPADYYDRMRTDYPELLTENVNSWFSREPTKRMLWTIGGTARAFLNNRYRRIDSMEIAKVVPPIIGQMEGAHFESCQITEGQMYMRIVNTRLEAEVIPGDIVQVGLIISNSEVGQGSVNIQPLVYRLVCKNGMVVNDTRTCQYHTERINTLEKNFQSYSEEMLAAEDHVFVKKIEDTVKAAAGEACFS